MWSGGGIAGVDNATDVIDYITISTPSNSTDFGNLIIPRNYTAALDNGTNDRGINGGGIEDGGSPHVNEIDYWTISTTGNAGPSKGDSDAEVGTVFIGIATPTGVFSQEFKMGSQRERVISKSVNKAFELLQKEILKN